MSNNVSSNTQVLGIQSVGLIVMFALPIVYLIGGCVCKRKPKSQTSTHHVENQHVGTLAANSSFVGNKPVDVQQTSENSDQKNRHAGVPSIVSPVVLIVENDSSADLHTLKNSDQVLSPRIQTAVDKIKAQQAGIAADYTHITKHATLSAEPLEVLERETKDALGVIRCEIDSTTTARDTKQKMMEEIGKGHVRHLGLVALTEGIEHLRGQLDLVIGLFTAWDLRSTHTQYSKHELKALPLASTQPGATPTTLTVQRVIGELTVAEAQGEDVGAHMKLALEVYNEGRNSAAATITKAIIADDQQYTECMRPHWNSPSEVAALKDLANVSARMIHQTLANGATIDKEWTNGGEFDADALTFDSAAPDATTARAIYNRHVAASGSIALYEILFRLSSTLSCKVEVIPGGVKALARMVFKSVLNYNADFSKCRDATRATMEVHSIKDVVIVVNALLASPDIVIVRTKDRFQRSYDSRPIGGYRDFQALCVFKHNEGWVYGEVQLNLAELVQIKGRKGGGHDVFKYARSIAAYTESTYTWQGAASIEMCDRIENGMLINVDLSTDETLTKDTVLFNRFLKSLQSTHCRVASLDLGSNKLGERRGVAMAEALKTNTSLTHLNLSQNRLGEMGGVAMAEALTVNTSLINLNLRGNKLGEKSGVAMADALKMNTSLTDLKVGSNQIHAATQGSIRTAWGDRSGGLATE
eukprot:m.104705 g.104705  ORF g.104705 m.104705 type:complete len:701 (-) comp27588_c0_seq1:69-2171(-)